MYRIAKGWLCVIDEPREIRRDARLEEARLVKTVSTTG